MISGLETASKESPAGKGLNRVLTPHLSVFVVLGNPRLPSSLMGVKALAIYPGSSGHNQCGSREGRIFHEEIGNSSIGLEMLYPYLRSNTIEELPTNLSIRSFMAQPCTYRSTPGHGDRGDQSRIPSPPYGRPPCRPVSG